MNYPQLEVTKIQLRKIATEDGFIEKADFIKVALRQWLP